MIRLFPKALLFLALSVCNRSIPHTQTRKGRLMKTAYALSAFCVVFSFAASAWAEPSSPACEGALDRISTARKALVPFRRTLEMVRAYENQANGESSACIGEGRWKVGKPIRCLTYQWKTPKPTKYDLAAVNQYRKERKAFEDLFTQAKQICLLEP